MFVAQRVELTSRELTRRPEPSTSAIAPRWDSVGVEPRGDFGPARLGVTQGYLLISPPVVQYGVMAAGRRLRPGLAGRSDEGRHGRKRRFDQCPGRGPADACASTTARAIDGCHRAPP